MPGILAVDIFAELRSAGVERFSYERLAYDRFTRSSHGYSYSRRAPSVIHDQSYGVPSAQRPSFGISTQANFGWNWEDFIPDEWEEEWDRLVHLFLVEFWRYKPFPNATTGIKGDFFGYGSYEIGMRNTTVLDIAIFAISLYAGPAGPMGYVLGKTVNWWAYALWKLGEFVFDWLIDDEGKNAMLASLASIGVDPILGGATYYGAKISEDAKELRAEIGRGAKYYGGILSKEAKDLGGEVAGGAKYYGGKIAGDARHLGEQISSGAKHLGGQISDEAKHFGGHLAVGAKHVGGQIFRGSKYAGGQISDAWKIAGITGSTSLKVSLPNHISSGLKGVGSRIEKGAGAVGGRAEKGARDVGRKLDPSSW